MPAVDEQTESSPEKEQGQGDIKVKEVTVSQESPDSSLSGEQKKAKDIQEDGDGVKSPASAPHTETVTDEAQKQVIPSGDTSDKEADKAEVKGEGQGPRSTAHKDRPNIVDQVVRNTEKVFTMLKK